LFRNGPKALLAVALLLPAAPSAAQGVSFSDALPQGPGLSEGPVLWPTLSMFAGVAVAFPSEPPAPTYVGPVGWSVGVDAKLNVGHAIAVGLRYAYTAFGSNDGSAGREEPVPSQHLFLQYIYDQVVAHEILAIVDVPFVNTAHLRWGGVAGVGVGLEQVRMQQFIAPDQDGNGVPESKPALHQLMKRQDTGPAFTLGTALEYFPVDFLSLAVTIQASYRYSPNLSLEEGALCLQGLFAAGGHF
jgi:hypothetical protein